MKKIILILISSLLFTACSKDDSTEQVSLKADKVIFGGIYGMCSGDCRDLYLINEKGVFKDGDNDSDQYGDWSFTTFEEKIDESLYENAQDLLNVPTILLEKKIKEEDLVQSWADVDYYLYIEKDGKSQEFILDHIHKNASPEIKSYFKIFLRSYKELGGNMIDTTNIEKYY